MESACASLKLYPLALSGLFALQDLYSFCSYVLMIQLAMFLLYASRVAQHPHSAASVVQRIVNVFLRAVPIAMPTVIIFSLFCCMLKLMRIGISVHDPSKVRLAADVEVAVFDKTGTLTGSMVSSVSS